MLLESCSASETMNMDRVRAYTFPKTRRLTRPSEYERVKRDGFRLRGKLLTLGALRIAGSGPSRAGIVTSRQLGGAVIRNRVRRRLREIVRLHQHQLRDDFWLVLVARRDAATADYAALRDEWLRLARRASILHECVD